MKDEVPGEHAILNTNTNSTFFHGRGGSRGFPKMLASMDWYLGWKLNPFDLLTHQEFSRAALMYWVISLY